MLYKIIPIVLWLAFMVASSFFDAPKIKEGKKINHFWRFIFRVGVAGAIVLAFHLYQNEYLWTAFMTFAGFSFSLGFNLMVNKLIGAPSDNLSPDSWFDRLEGKLGFKQALYAKIGFAGIALGGYFASWPTY